MSDKFSELQPGSFIYTLPNALDADFCHEVIERFESAADLHREGVMGPGGAVDESIKRSTDLRITGLAQWRDVDERLLQSLQHGLSLLSGLHPFFSSNAFKDMGYQLQRSVPGVFYRWHVDSGPGPLSQRQLVAIWYLNSVAEPGGATEFFHQKVRVQPEVGKLLLFPPFWTHLHQGDTVATGHKYIATTWVCFA